MKKTISTNERVLFGSRFWRFKGMALKPQLLVALLTLSNSGGMYMKRGSSHGETGSHKG